MPIEKVSSPVSSCMASAAAMARWGLAGARLRGEGYAAMAAEPLPIGVHEAARRAVVAAERRTAGAAEPVTVVVGRPAGVADAHRGSVRGHKGDARLTSPHLVRY